MASHALIEELETAFASKDISGRADALRRIADLFTSGSGRYSGEQIELFDDVMSSLLTQVDVAARSAFGISVMEAEDAPPHTLRALALDDSIEVAGPILSRCVHLSERVLIEGALSKSQEHLMAISRRKMLSEAVTDALVDRGNPAVVRSTAANHGAKFSESGLSKLTSQASADQELAISIWSRPDIPRSHLLRLFSEASEVVRARMLEADSGKARLIDDMLAQGLERLQAGSRDQSAAYASAEAYVRGLHDAGELDEVRLHDFAEANQFENALVAFKLICDVPIGVIERAMVEDSAERVIVLARAAGLSWETTSAILKLRARNHGQSREEVARSVESFRKLQPETAKKALQFYRLRDRAIAERSGG